MDASKVKRIFSLVAAVVLIVAFGCGKAAVREETPTDGAGKQAISGAQEPTAADALPTDDGAEETHTGVISVNEPTDQTESGSYASSGANECVIVIQGGGILSLSGADIQKTGDAEGSFSSGLNAAIAVLTQGKMTLSGSNITTNALGGFGLYTGGAGSALTCEDTCVYTSGGSSPALVAKDGGVISFTGGTVSTEGADSPCVLLEGGKVSLTGVSLQSTSGEFLRVLSGANELVLDGTVITASPILAEGAALKLVLQNGASFTGELGNEPPAKVSVTLDAKSTLSLSADTYLVALVNADAAHQNIQSNGFSLYYDSNAPENAYLGGQSFALPGGGYLTPMI